MCSVDEFENFGFTGALPQISQVTMTELYHGKWRQFHGCFVIHLEKKQAAKVI